LAYKQSIWYLVKYGHRLYFNSQKAVKLGSGKRMGLDKRQYEPITLSYETHV